jgi:hypothetical protein
MAIQLQDTTFEVTLVLPHHKTYLLNPFLWHLMVSRFFFHFDHFTDGRTPWTGDQLVARSLPNTGKHKHRINTYTHQTSMPSGIGTHDPGFRRQYMPETARLPWPASSQTLCFHVLMKQDRSSKFISIAINRSHRTTQYNDQHVLIYRLVNIIL